MRTPFRSLCAALVAFLSLVGVLLGAATPALAAPPARPAPSSASSASSPATTPDDDADDATNAGSLGELDPTIGLPWQIGPRTVTLGQGVQVAVPDGRRFLGQPEAGRLMEKFGNLHNEDLLGVVLPTAQDEDWMVTIRFDAEGFIKDDESLDGKEILEAIREGEPAYNEERKKLGFPPIHADGWMEDPRYDHVLWALVVSSERGTSVNLNTRLLGRKGYVSVNLVTAKDELARYRPIGAEMLRATTFEAGSRYEDFDSKTDKVAEYGLTGLVLGGAGVGLAKAAKIGLLAKFWKGILALLIAGKKGVVALLAALAAGAKKLFGGKKARPATEGGDDDAPPSP
jgi:uncharacterized membrane-anchored protein